MTYRNTVLRGAVAVAATLAIAACSPEAREETNDAAQEVSNDVSAAFAELRAETSQAVDAADRRLEELQADMADAGDDIKAEWNDLDASIDARRAEIARKYDELEAASAEQAREIRADINEELREIEYDVDRMRLRAAETRADFAAEAEQQYNAATAELAQLNDRVANLGDDAREEWNESVRELQEKSNELQEDLNELQAEADDDFDDARDDLADGFAEFRANVQAALRRIDYELRS